MTPQRVEGADGADVGNDGAPQGGSGADWSLILGGAVEKGLSRWIDVETFRATGGAGVPEWSRTTQEPTPGSVVLPTPAGLPATVAGVPTWAIALGAVVALVLALR